MGDLFWNKIIGALLATGLALFALREIGHLAVHSSTPEELAYAVDVGAPAVVDTEEDKGPVDFGTLLRTASISSGERVFAAKCASCHSAAPDGANGIGPALWGVYGRVAGAHAGFGYTAAMTEYAEAWLPQNLYDYLEKPQRYIRGTAMNFIGLRKQEERLNVIAFLNSLAPTPVAFPDPLPAVVEEAAETLEAAEAVEATAESVEQTAAATADAAQAELETAAENVTDAAEEAVAPSTEPGE